VPGPEPSDAELIRDSLTRHEAFRVLFERHYDAVRRYSQRMIGVDGGEEVAAQTFLVAFEHRRAYDLSYPSARPWLFGIAHNLVRHHVRSEQYRRDALAHIAFERDPSDVLDIEALEAARLAPLALRALRALREEERDPFVLVAVGQLTYRETAQVLGVPIGTIRSRMHRTRAALQELFTDAGVTLDEAQDVGTDAAPDPTGEDA
jgi:RNA polymerase sigma factor (sigma-70 family)